MMNYEDTYQYGEQASTSSNPYIRFLACQALGYSRDARSIEPLVRMMDDQDAVIRARAISYFLRLKSSAHITQTQHDALGAKVVPILTRRLKDEDERVRKQAAYALCWVSIPENHEQQTYSALAEARRDTVVAVSQQAVVALRYMEERLTNVAAMGRSGIQLPNRKVMPTAMPAWFRG
ncbi:hypothetical protein COX84_01350 [Candidatus Micrarchaeota archaeon CG_4_10_14_0_2_um_filter_49_7]|nr:MAG: hypothetical protein COX84_01350 [Candidatus Micrarchaeota archaeon CG_4_10_14_0_2_um_filter_49_7]HII54181.1 HEAT repeat domain-containing protein [Candidatus Micrarchaeota archaeon]